MNRQDFDFDGLHAAGKAFFEMNDDIKEEELGKKIKEYDYKLAYEDYLTVTTFERGAEIHYSVTGSTKRIRNKVQAFSMAKMMQHRYMILNNLMGE